LSSPAAAQAEDGEVAGAAAVRRLVVIVDDDPRIRRLFRKYVESLGLEAEEASSGKAALTLLLAVQRTPALICLDVVLPEFSGYEICELIRASARLAHVPVLMISARSTPPDRALAEEVGASAYLTKPIDRASFLETVSRLLQQAKDDPSLPPRIVGAPANDAREIPGEETSGLRKSTVPMDLGEKR
jgi:two-component system chemotaxis response regulator CheY